MQSEQVSVMLVFHFQITALLYSGQARLGWQQPQGPAPQAQAGVWPNQTMAQIIQSRPGGNYWQQKIRVPVEKFSEEIQRRVAERVEKTKQAA